MSPQSTGRWVCALEDAAFDTRVDLSLSLSLAPGLGALVIFVSEMKKNKKREIRRALGSWTDSGCGGGLARGWRA